MNVCWLDSREARNSSRFGGKAANLARLAAAHPVPRGFCVEASDAADLAPDVAAGIAAAYAELGARCGTIDPPVAVRSSAVDEDGQEASFAGQHESYLNVVGAEAVTAAVGRCIASAHTERAQEYRRAHRLAAHARVAVLVQLLVASDVSVVAFSADPRSGEHDRIVVNAAWGLGESLVGGSVTPDLFVVRAEDETIVSRQIADKACMTVACTGGTREVAVPRCLRREPALTDDQVREVARLARALEQTCGWAADVECAYERGRLWLLQCRPVTTLVR